MQGWRSSVRSLRFVLIEGSHRYSSYGGVRECVRELTGSWSCPTNSGEPINGRDEGIGERSASSPAPVHRDDCRGLLRRSLRVPAKLAPAVLRGGVRWRSTTAAAAAAAEGLCGGERRAA